MKKDKRNEGLGNTLKDRLNGDLVSKLASKKQTLQKQQEEVEERQRQERIEERRRKEKNKSFEELLAESNMDWKKFK
ncbi:YqkE family protein [Aquibacillus kalidii]|uniref:YqkE family protein n=1 Tax=Aquibacillus kalidii TaxID=2762597 RepID=UPI001648D536|nr:YqkE family protein [Aquibacillus kalidii]